MQINHPLVYNVNCPLPVYNVNYPLQVKHASLQCKPPIARKPPIASLQCKPGKPHCQFTIKPPVYCKLPIARYNVNHLLPGYVNTYCHLQFEHPWPVYNANCPIYNVNHQSNLAIPIASFTM